MNDLPRFINVIMVDDSEGTYALTVSGDGETPGEALIPLTKQIEGSWGPVPNHSVYLNVARPPQSLAELHRLVLLDPFTAAVYEQGRRAGYGQARRELEDR
jgi:hypothetical protein